MDEIKKPTINTEEKASHQEKEIPALRRKRVRWLAILSIALVLTVLGGYFAQQSLLLVGPPELNQALGNELKKRPGGNLHLDFPGTRQIPGGAGLQGWLDGFPQPERITGVGVTFKSLYTIDGRGDWDLTLNPQGNLIVRTPIPELREIQVLPGDLHPQTAQPLSAEDQQLAHEILREKVIALLRQEEGERRIERLNDSRQMVRTFVLDLMAKTRQPIPVSVEVRFAEETGQPEEEIDNTP